MSVQPNIPENRFQQIIVREYEKRLAERFRFSPQAAMTYFGILVSSCKVLIEVPDCRVLVVEDRELGTNDCRGWLSESLFRKLQHKHQAEILAKEMEKLVARAGERITLSEKDEPALLEQAKLRIRGKQLGCDRFYQFCLAFDKTQPNGSFK